MAAEMAVGRGAVTRSSSPGLPIASAGEYGLVDGRMTEATPYRPVSNKGAADLSGSRSPDGVEAVFSDR